MKIGLIVFSQNGHSMSIAGKIEKRLNNEKRDVNLEQIKINGNLTSNQVDFSITEKPENPEKYDILVFISFVMAFSLNPVMKKYLDEIPDLSGKTAFCIAAKHFKSNWTGGNSAVNTMKRLCGSKGINVVETGILSKKKNNYDVISWIYCVYDKKYDVWDENYDVRKVLFRNQYFLLF